MSETPIPMRLTCPDCNDLHIDEGVFATKPHHTHSCQGCGLTWRPAVVATVGVRFLPGFKNEGDTTQSLPRRPDIEGDPGGLADLRAQDALQLGAVHKALSAFETRAQAGLNASDIREKLGEPKPHEAEWTWEHAVNMVEQVVVNRAMWRRRAEEVTAQRERCDRMISQAAADIAELQGRLNARRQWWPSKSTPTLGKLAEKIVYAITRQWADINHPLHLGFQQLSQMQRAELVTTWIEQTQAILEDTGK